MIKKALKIFTEYSYSNTLLKEKKEQEEKLD